MKELRAWWSGLPPIWKGITTVTAALLVGFGAGATLAASQFVTAPSFAAVRDRVEATEMAVENLQGAVAEQEARTDNMQTIIERIDYNSCLTLLEVRGDSNTDRCRR